MSKKSTSDIFEDVPYRANDAKATEVYWSKAIPHRGIAEFRRLRGQRGAQKAPTKKLVSVRFDLDVLETFRASGPGWQTRINAALAEDRKSTRLNSSHQIISYAVFCLKKKNQTDSDCTSGFKNTLSLSQPKHARPRARRNFQPLWRAQAGARQRRCPRVVFLLNDTATTEIYTLSLHDALPI